MPNESASNGTIKKSTRKGKKAMVYMEGKWHHFGDSAMGHNYSASARARAKSRHKKNLEGNDPRARANRVYWKKYWEKGGSVKSPNGDVKSHTRTVKGKSNSTVRRHRRRKKK